MMLQYHLDGILILRLKCRLDGTLASALGLSLGLGLTVKARVKLALGTS